MPKFAANLTMLFTELPFMSRFEAASKAGFKYVEYLFPYQWPAKELAEALDANGLERRSCARTSRSGYLESEV